MVDCRFVRWGFGKFQSVFWKRVFEPSGSEPTSVGAVSRPVAFESSHSWPASAVWDSAHPSGVGLRFTARQSPLPFVFLSVAFGTVRPAAWSMPERLRECLRESEREPSGSPAYGGLSLYGSPSSVSGGVASWDSRGSVLREPVL